MPEHKRSADKYSYSVADFLLAVVATKANVGKALCDLQIYRHESDLRALTEQIRIGCHF
jgi:hypothetical protein